MSVVLGKCKYDAHITQIIHCHEKSWNMSFDAATEYCNNFNYDDLEGEPCPELTFDNSLSHGTLTCKNVKENDGLVTKTCILDCDLGYVPSYGEIFVCSDSNHYAAQWTLRDRKTRITSSNVTCERPLAFIVGGKYCRVIHFFLF